MVVFCLQNMQVKFSPRVSLLQFQTVCQEYQTYGNVGESETDEVESFIRDIKVLHNFQD